MRVIFCLCCLLCCPLRAQTGSWSRGEAVPEGTHVALDTYRTLPCTVESVSESGVACELHGSTFWVERTIVHRVLLPKRKAATVVGTLVGAAALGTLTSLRYGDAEPSSRTLGTVLGLALGGYAGYGIGHLVDRHSYEVLYEQP